MISFYVCAIVTAASACTSLGFSVATLRTAEGEAGTNAMYAAARSTALTVASIVPFLYHADPFLVAVALTMTIVQAVDALVGTRIKSRLKTVGPGITAVVNLIALVWLRN